MELFNKISNEYYWGKYIDEGPREIKLCERYSKFFIHMSIPGSTYAFGYKIECDFTSHECELVYEFLGSHAGRIVFNPSRPYIDPKLIEICKREIRKFAVSLKDIYYANRRSI